MEIEPQIMYKTLLQDIKKIRDDVNKRLTQTTNTITLNGYRQIGRLLSESPLMDKSAEKTTIRLAKDLLIEVTLLRRMLQFYRIWPLASPQEEAPALTWSHYKLLLPLSGEGELSFYFQKAARENWSVRLLTEKIKHGAFETAKENMMLSQQKNMPEETPVLSRKPNACHVYAGEVTRIVDGDTLVMSIDLGFDVWTKKRIRFRGINTAEMTSEDETEKTRAVAAKHFVEKKLPVGTSITIQTFLTDLHGRYVADVFYLPGEKNKEAIFKDGLFLNQELLNAKLATLI